MNLKQYASRVGRCELLEAASEEVVKAYRSLNVAPLVMRAKPVKFKHFIKKPQSPSAKAKTKINEMKANMQQQHSRTSMGGIGKPKYNVKGGLKTAAMAAIGIPTGALMIGDGEYAESDSIIRRAKLFEEGNEVEMPKKVYVKEHKHLIKVLKKCKTASAKQEAAKQTKEMRKEVKENWTQGRRDPQYTASAMEVLKRGEAAIPQHVAFKLARGYPVGGAESHALKLRKLRRSYLTEFGPQALMDKLSSFRNKAPKFFVKKL